MPLRCSWCQII